MANIKNDERLVSIGDPLEQWKNAPSDWEERTLWELAEYINGRIFKRTDFSNNGLKIIKIKELKYGISSDTASFKGDYEDKHLLCNGDLLFAWSGNPKTSLDVFRWQNGPAILNQHIFRVIPKKGIDRTYLYYLLKFLRPTFIRTALDKATSMGHVKISDLKRLIAKFPPLNKQCTVAAILGNLDSKINLNTKINTALEKVERLLFKQWFMDFEFPDKEGIRYRLSGSKMKKSKLGEIPQDWEIKEMSTVSHIIDCLHNKKPRKAETGKILLQVFNIDNDGKLDLSDLYHVSDSDYENWTRNIELKAGDCIISKTGRVGAVAQIPKGFLFGIGRNLVAIRPVEITPTFLLEYLLSGYGKREIHKLTVSGTILRSLHVKYIKKIPILIPPNGILNEYEKISRPMRSQIENNAEENIQLVNLRNKLLPKLISGKIRVEEES